jgi:hypothetical protein
MRSIIAILVFLALAAPIVSGWTLAPALKQLFDDVNRFAPRRGKASDGSIGDSAHSARTSDHNPDGRGIVHAIDITHDPSKGFDSYKFAEFQRTHPDPRVKYIISCRKIWTAGSSEWRRYTGTNAHCHHVHISLKSGSSVENNRAAWTMYDGSAPTTNPTTPTTPTIPANNNNNNNANPRCRAAGGSCSTSCSGGTMRSGLCTGAASVRCCVPRTPNVKGLTKEPQPMNVPRAVNKGHHKVNVEVNVNTGSSKRVNGEFDEAI